MMRLFVLVSIFCMAQGAFAQEAKTPDTTSQKVRVKNPEENAKVEPYWKFTVLPRFTFSSDNGIGGGARAVALFHNKGAKPYKTAISAQAWLTNRLVQHHFLGVDAIDAFNLPLRITAEAGFFQSLTQNFCGTGSSVTCDETLAEEASLGVARDQREEFVKNYYRVRYFRPYLNALARYRFNQRPHRAEIFAGWRGHFYQPGTLADDDKDGAPDLFAYRGSFYDQARPGGERGFASVAQVGVALDDRDHEAAPQSGYLLQASARLASPFLGSDFSYAGVNAAARVYAPLFREYISLASRIVVDHIIGDELPIQELARGGGLNDYLSFGGQDMGRGIRVQRFIGRTKVMSQHEIRFRFREHTFLGQTWKWGAALFMDIGTVSNDDDALSGKGFSPLVGWGVSGRLLLNKNVPMRFDIGFSHHENFRPFVYTVPGFVY